MSDLSGVSYNGKRDFPHLRTCRLNAESNCGTFTEGGKSMGGWKRCPQCGEKCRNNVRKCPSCGYVFEKKECPDCGAVIDDDIDECPICGWLFSDEFFDERDEDYDYEDLEDFHDLSDYEDED